MTESTDTSLTDRLYIASILKKVETEYQQIGPERGRLHQVEFDYDDDDDTVLDIVTLCDVYVDGAASQIADNGSVSDVEKVMEYLNYRFFDYPHCLAWYESPENDFPGIKAFIRHTDYLRLLVREYIQKYQ